MFRCILGDPGAASRDEGIFVGESLHYLSSRMKKKPNVNYLEQPGTNKQRSYSLHHCHSKLRGSKDRGSKGLQA